jgi:ribonucleoside-diphosphate reductase alpha chain
MSLQALSDYIIYSKYSHFLSEEKRRETWEEITDRVFKMHEKKYAKFLKENVEFRNLFEASKQAVKDKKVLGSQRALQFASDNPEFGILKKNEKIFNCTSTLLDRPRAFQEIGYVLLNGCGAGYSVQYHHVNKLPEIVTRIKGKKIYCPEDSIEGWSECWGILINSFFKNGIYAEYEGFEVNFDLSKIRPAGSLIAGQFKAPGPQPLEKSLLKIKELIELSIKNGQKTLTPLNVHDIICHIADAIISGGVRRSALISLFSFDDKEMRECKTGSWFIENPQRARANNSVVLERGKITKADFDEIFKNIKSYGEPGFYFVDDGAIHQVTNPCCEIGFWPISEKGESGFGFCNLCEINGSFCKTKEDFLNTCKYASFIGTLQAGYDSTPYLGTSTQDILRKEALLGVSITGWMDNPDLLFDKKNLSDGVKMVAEINKITAKIIGINAAARLTCTKPSGTASSVLMTGSGIHPQHSKKFLRRAQANKKEFAAKVIKKKNSIAVHESVWSSNKTDNVVSFPCEAPSKAIVKKDLNALQFLEKVKFAYQNWVIPGTNKEMGLNEAVTHNISVTVSVGKGEWDSVRDYIFENRKYFSGISLLSTTGDLDYDQAPFVEVLDPKELAEKYGDGVPLASGLIVDGLHAFSNLWIACATALGEGEKLEVKSEPIEPSKPKRKKGTSEKEYSNILADYAIGLNLFYQEKGEYESLELKRNWVRRAKQFADRYFNGDVQQMTYCLKHVSIWKDWLDIKREWKDIDWANIKENEQEFVNADTMTGISCSGGNCEILK